MLCACEGCTGHFTYDMWRLYIGFEALLQPPAVLRSHKRHDGIPQTPRKIHDNDLIMYIGLATPISSLRLLWGV